jgi:hypothetical protein
MASFFYRDQRFLFPGRGGMRFVQELEDKTHTAASCRSWKKPREKAPYIAV